MSHQTSSKSLSFGLEMNNISLKLKTRKYSNQERLGYTGFISREKAVKMSTGQNRDLIRVFTLDLYRFIYHHSNNGNMAKMISIAFAEIFLRIFLPLEGWHQKFIAVKDRIVYIGLDNFCSMFEMYN